MEKIASFTIDHNRLLRGVYVSRRDTTPSGDVLTTFDIRLTMPNREPATCRRKPFTPWSILPPHIFATTKNGKTRSYIGRMGCFAPEITS